jgi:Ser/Thr protein kinase RdoA (MazF antagonist)
MSQRSLIIKCLAAYYPIESLQPLEGPYWNASFRAVGPDGVFYVKVFNEETTGVMRTINDLDIVAIALEDLYHVGFHSIARPKRSHTGTSVFRCGPFLAMVFDWIENERVPFNESNAQSFDLIEVCSPVLARLHAAGRQVQHVSRGLMYREIPYAYAPTRWVDTLNELWLNAENNIRERGYSSTTLSELRRARGLCEDLIVRRQAFFDRTANEYTILHGDFRPENLMHAKEPVVIDFDMIHIGPPEADIAYASLCFSGPRWFMGPRVLAKCAAFVRAYRNSSDIRVVNSQLLEAALEYVILKSASLSFKEEQLLARLALYRQVRGGLDLITEGVYNPITFLCNKIKEPNSALPMTEETSCENPAEGRRPAKLKPSDVPGHITPHEGSWLADLARGGVVIEIGTYRGRSTCFLAKEACIVVTCDPFCGQHAPRPEQHRVDFNEVRRNWAENTNACGVRHRVVLLELLSKEAYLILEQNVPAIFDLAFIDGSHDESDLRGDVRFANFLRVGGIIAFHDYVDSRYPDVQRIIDQWELSFGDAFELIPAVGTIRAFRKRQHQHIAADWSGAEHEL